jgi:hypothetical protein
MAATKNRRQSKGGARREAIVAAVAQILGAGWASKFEYEGACRHGLRSAFCLRGSTWAAADARAAEIVAEALKRNGAERPSWWQGQPEYADTDTSRGWCSRHGCGRPIPIDRGSSNGFAVKFCSDFCKQNAHAQHQRQFGVQQSLAEFLAACAAQSQQTMEARARDCAHCGRHFLTRTSGRLYCSRACFSAAKTIHAERPCAHCGTPFRPEKTHLGLSKYCCRACSDAGRRKPREDRECPVCGTKFRPRWATDRKRFCSPRCVQLNGRHGNGYVTAEKMT